MANVSTGVPSAGLCVRSGFGLGFYNRVFLKWTIPDVLAGATINSATLHTKPRVYDGSVFHSLSVGFYGPVAAWDASATTGDSGDTLWGLPLGTQLASRVFVPADSDVELTFNVLGDLSWGIKAQHAIPGRTYFSIFIDDLTNSNTGTTKDSQWWVGNNEWEAGMPLVTFDSYPGSFPYIDIDYTPAAGGIFAFSAGKVN